LHFSLYSSAALQLLLWLSHVFGKLKTASQVAATTTPLLLALVLRKEPPTRRLYSAFYRSLLTASSTTEPRLKSRRRFWLTNTSVAKAATTRLPGARTSVFLGVVC
jgi:hypothetical protein